MEAILAIFATSFVVSLSGALAPGPLFTLTVRETLRRGFWAGPVVATGHALIELALVIGLALGMKRFLEEEGTATAAIALAGGAVLLWMGLQMLRSAPRQALDLSRESAGVAGNPGTVPAARPATMAATLVPAGALVSVSNPYWVLWWASIGAAYMSESLDEGAAGVASFFTAHILSDYAWLGLVAFVLATGRRLMSRGIYRGLLGACGVFLLVLGVRFIYVGVDFLA